MFSGFISRDTGKAGLTCLPAVVPIGRAGLSHTIEMAGERFGYRCRCIASSIAIPTPRRARRDGGSPQISEHRLDQRPVKASLSARRSHPKVLLDQAGIVKKKMTHGSNVPSGAT